MTKRRRSVEQTNPSVSDAQSFRRILHAHGAVGKGLNWGRRHLKPSAVVTVVRQLFQVPVYATAFATNPFPRSFELIKPRRALSPTTPELDLIWNAAVLGCFSEDLCRYVPLRDEFYEAINGANFDAARIRLQEIEDKFGVSTWLMFSRLLLIQQSEGISAQKAYLQEVIERDLINPFWAYLAFYFSFGLEENVSVAELNREINQLSQAGAQQDVIGYFRYHASPLGLSAVENPFDCITLEENSPIVDRFETFVEMSQLLAMRSDNPESVPFLREALEQIADVPDLRLQNLRFLLAEDGEFAASDPQFLEACEAYTKGDTRTATNLVTYAIGQTPAAAWWYELASRLKISSPAAEPEGRSLAWQIVDGFGAAAAFDRADSSAESNLQKLAQLVRKQPAALCIAAFLDRKADLNIAARFSENQALWAMSSPLENPAHFRVISQVRRARVSSVIRAAAEQAPVCAQLHSAVMDPESSPFEKISTLPVPAGRIAQYEGHYKFNSGDVVAARKHYQEYLSSESVDRFRAIHNIYMCLRSLDLANDAAELIARTYLERPPAFSMFPVKQVTSWLVERGDIDEWAVYRALVLQAALERGALGMEGDLSDAYEDVLDFYGCTRPTELLQCDVQLEREVLVSFLENICTVSRMEDTTHFERLEEIEAERITILQWLIARATKDSIQKYKDEIAAIVKDQEVARLAAQFDRSRIYVDERAVRKLIDPELRDAVARYKQLLAAPDLEVQVEGLEQSLRRLLKLSQLDIPEFHLPSTEKEGLFRTLYHVALDAFALSPAHGFQTYLSTRILHGSLEGELRASFAQRNLLFSEDPQEARQELNSLWRDRLSALDEPSFEQVRRIMLRLSQRVTEGVAELKREVIRVRSPEAPRGIFVFDASNAEFEAVQRSLTSDTSYDEFITRLFAHFWDLAERDLDAAREAVQVFSGKVESYVTAAVGGLSSLSRDGMLSEVTDALGHAVTDFLADVQRVTSWFSRSGVMPAEPFTIEVATGVATKITNNCYPTSPISPIVLGDVAEIEGSYLNAVVDLLANCFHNSVQHSGVVGRAPEIEVSCMTADDGFEVLVQSELDECKEIAVVQAQIDEKLLADEGGSGVMSEGGSGLRKIRRILRHDIRTQVPLRVWVSQSFQVNVAMFVPGQEIPN